MLRLSNITGYSIGRENISNLNISYGIIFILIGLIVLIISMSSGLEEIVDKSQDVLAKEAIASEKAAMQRFFSLLSTKPNMVCYGHDDLLRKLQLGVVEVVLVSESVDEKIIEDLERIGATVSTTIELISVETREGVQLKEMGGFAGILRYEME